jgi:3-hydroxyacyl-[acyl-carrier-protein] dehydratase
MTDVQTKGPLDIRAVLAFLPHRYPMLLVDRVEEIVPDTSIRAISRDGRSCQAS